MINLSKLRMNPKNTLYENITDVKVIEFYVKCYENRKIDQTNLNQKIEVSLLSHQSNCHSYAASQNQT